MKGKHKKRAENRARSRASERESVLRQRLEREAQDRQLAEEEATRASALMMEIGSLRAMLDEICSEEQQCLEEDIRLLSAERERLKAESSQAIHAHDPDSEYVSLLVFGPGRVAGTSIDSSETLILEVERRMAERYPDMPKPPGEVFITSGVDNAKKLDADGVKAIQRARGIRR